MPVVEREDLRRILERFWELQERLRVDLETTR